jgi:hypothetical protein
MTARVLMSHGSLPVCIRAKKLLAERGVTQIEEYVSISIPSGAMK